MEENFLYQADISAGHKIFRGGGKFLTGAVNEAGLPPMDRPEICFCGRSNVGKSSLINGLLNQQGLARVSKTPGRTQQINFFESPSQQLYIADLPGYGYASTSTQTKVQWQSLLPPYLLGRGNLKRVFLLIDSRHGVKKNDLELIEMFCTSATIFQVVLTKTDKISPTALQKIKETTQTALEKKAAFFPHIIATSVLKKEGLDQLRGHIARLLQSI